MNDRAERFGVTLERIRAAMSMFRREAGRTPNVLTLGAEDWQDWLAWYQQSDLPRRKAGPLVEMLYLTGVVEVEITSEPNVLMVAWRDLLARPAPPAPPRVAPKRVRVDHFVVEASRATSAPKVAKPPSRRRWARPIDPSSILDPDGRHGWDEDASIDHAPRWVRQLAQEWTTLEPWPDTSEFSLRRQRQAISHYDRMPLRELD